MIPLFGEGHQEAFLALFILESHHCLFNVVVVSLQLLLEVDSLVVEAGEGKADSFEFALALNASAVFCTDVNRDGVEKVLVVVVPCYTIASLKPEYVFEGSALELGVGHCCDIDERISFGVGAAFSASC